MGVLGRGEIVVGFCDELAHHNTDHDTADIVMCMYV